MQCISNPAMVRARSLSPLASRAPRRVSRSRASSVLGPSHRLSPPRTPTPLRPVPAGRPPDDEIHRRIRVHRGVYGVHGDVTPDEHTLFHSAPRVGSTASSPSAAAGTASSPKISTSSARSRRSPTPRTSSRTPTRSSGSSPGTFTSSRSIRRVCPTWKGSGGGRRTRGKVLVRGAVDAKPSTRLRRRARGGRFHAREIHQRLSAVIGRESNRAPTRAIRSFYRLPRRRVM